MRKRRNRLLLLIALPAGLGLAGVHGCGRDRAGASDRAAAESPPVMLIGADGVEWNLVLPMLAEGRLPNIRGLMERGSCGLLETIIPTSSPIIWTTIVTGKSRQQHGINGFVYHDPRHPDAPQLYTSADRKTSAIWNIVSAQDKRANVIGWWMSFPAERINGVMVAQYNTSTPELSQAGKMIWKGTLIPGVRGQVHPPARQAEILDIAAQVRDELPQLAQRIFGRAEATDSPVLQRLWDNCMWSFRADVTYQRVGLKLLRDGPASDLFMVYFGGTDVFAHRFWRYMQPGSYDTRPTEEEVAAYGELIRTYYAHIDDVIGRLLAAAPPETDVIIVSDHGMVPVNLDGAFSVDLKTRDLLSANHERAEPGFFVAAGPRIRQMGGKPAGQLTRDDLRRIASIFDITPTILALLKLPVARDMDGTVLGGVIEPSFLDAHPVRFIDTYDTPGWDADRYLTADVDSPNTQERLEQLRALGYVE